ncbi:hypothetical protein Arub01_57360 [Actinomadura rubrobrunea]|uniref:Uncharacterized protein n=1 Tax=Actinomadura rubrobrunea TaxID=115335 RepID=A0A9W6Q305_9ACTN|nr:hypothetical protein Arub01_57360 [Actinomadura rubrobrunea]
MACTHREPPGEACPLAVPASVSARGHRYRSLFTAAGRLCPYAVALIRMLRPERSARSDVRQCGVRTGPLEGQLEFARRCKLWRARTSAVGVDLRDGAIRDHHPELSVCLTGLDSPQKSRSYVLQSIDVTKDLRQR